MNFFAGTYLLPPVSLVVLLSIALLWLARGLPRKTRRRTRSLCVALGAVGLLATLPVTPKLLSWPLRSLVPGWEEENRPPVAAVVVPTGESFADPTGRLWPSSSTVRRTTVGAALAKETGLPLLVTGGSPLNEPISEAALVVDLLNLDHSTLLLDTTARNTHENALAVARLLDAQAIRSVVVVTDGIHITRMSASLRAAGIRPYGHTLKLHLDAPIEAMDFVPSNRGLGYLRQIASGYTGVLYYLARGRFSIGDLLGTTRIDSPDPPAD